MALRWRKRKTPEACTHPRPAQEEGSAGQLYWFCPDCGASLPISRSPLDLDSIGVGDPGWEMFAPFFGDNPPDAIISIYDTTDGSVVHTKEIRHDEGR